MGLFDDVKKMAKKEIDKQLKDPENEKKTGDLFKRNLRKRPRRNLKKTIKF